jgi:hypothetical protein
MHKHVPILMMDINFTKTYLCAKLNAHKILKINPIEPI